MNRRRKLFAVSLLSTILIGAFAAFLVLRSGREIQLDFLKEGELIVAFQQDWNWNHQWARERTRKYHLDAPFQTVLGQARRELLAKGWTEHQVRSSSPIYLFRERVGGYTVGIEEDHTPRGVRVTVSDPRGPVGTLGKLVSWVQCLDPRYVPAGEPVLAAYREFWERKAKR